MLFSLLINDQRSMRTRAFCGSATPVQEVDTIGRVHDIHVQYVIQRILHRLPISSRMKPVYIKLVSITVIVVTAFLLLKISRNSVTFSPKLQRTFSPNPQRAISIDDLTPDFYRNIPDDIYSCVKTTKTYEYDFDNTDLYLLPSKENMCEMKAEDLEKLYQMYLGTIQTICKRPLRLGKRNDGGWDICVEKQFLTPGACQVYSFGINYDFTFDDEIAKNSTVRSIPLTPVWIKRATNEVRTPLCTFTTLVSPVNPSK
ncbi:uncharacterized protein LOC117317621 isoform X2 [Pecten maximus]|uniref:uncharacterized protein LOC117317621 isoform X2 n=1 Tax=Pecten maximus TaxID=6579 RepID=UPI00145909BB|nr:uncharacterized protein LOC117317621 isoform X2 [Pecten maximus]